jgi:hypothetical protein
MSGFNPTCLFCRIRSKSRNRILDIELIVLGRVCEMLFALFLSRALLTSFACFDDTGMLWKQQFFDPFLARRFLEKFIEQRSLIQFLGIAT